MGTVVSMFAGDDTKVFVQPDWAPAMRLLYTEPEVDHELERICPTCFGNARNVPCAYPGDGMRGCLRNEVSYKEYPRFAADLAYFLRRVNGDEI